MITVFFPPSFTWQNVNEWVAERRLPVTMHTAADSIYAGRTFARYCDEIDYDTKTGCMVYHREKVQMRRAK